MVSEQEHEGEEEEGERRVETNLRRNRIQRLDEHTLVDALVGEVGQEERRPSELGSHPFDGEDGLEEGDLGESERLELVRMSREGL